MIDQVSESAKSHNAHRRMLEVVKWGEAFQPSDFQFWNLVFP